MVASINASTSAGVVVTSDTSGSLALQTNSGVTALTIDTSQNVGIGTSSPSVKLHVSASTDEVTRFQSSGNPFVSLYSGATRKGYIQAASDSLAIFNEYAVPMTFGTNSTERMRIDSSGNVGVGTSSPGYPLQVFTSSSSNANTISMVNNATSNTSALAFVQSGSTQASYSYITGDGRSSGYLGFSTNNAERMRIVSDGGARFSMGNFANGVSSTNAGIELANNGTSPFINHSQTPTSLTTYYAFINGNGVVGTIKCTGSSTQFNTSSDVRLKKNIVDAPSAIASIQQIGIKSFDWKADDLHQEYGVIAQDLDLIAPEAVSHGSTEDEMWGVDYSKLVPRMLKAIQEQQALIQTLQTQVAQLQSKVGE